MAGLFLFPGQAELAAGRAWYKVTINNEKNTAAHHSAAFCRDSDDVPSACCPVQSRHCHSLTQNNSSACHMPLEMVNFWKTEIPACMQTRK